METVETISLADDSPAAELVPVEELADCVETVLARDGKTLLSYGAGAGYTPLRELIGQWFGVHPFRVVLTNGSLQALGLLAQRLARHQSVLVEYPTYDRALTALLRAGSSLVSVVVDDDGMEMNDLEQQLQSQQRPAFVYTIPTFHNPTGRTLPEPRRRHLLEAALRRGVPVVEDAAYALLRFDGDPEPALFDLSGGATIYSSSFSTTIAPGLRVGWLILPEDLVRDVIELAATSYISPVLVGQAVAFEYIRRGAFESNLRRVNDLLRLRRDAMLSALAKHFGGASWTEPHGGYFVWLQLPHDVDARPALERAEGVTALAGTAFGAGANAVRLAYCLAAPDEIETGIERLAAAF